MNRLGEQRAAIQALASSRDTYFEGLAIKYKFFDDDSVWSSEWTEKSWDRGGSRLRGALATMRQNFNRLDLTRLTAKQVQVVYRIYCEELPQLSEMLRASYYEGKTSSAYLVKWSRRRWEGFYSDLNRVLRDQAKTAHAVAPVEEPPTKTQQITEGPATLTFPVYEDAETDTEVLASLDELQAAWTRARGRNLTVDDDYFVEQVARTFVPELIRLYRIVMDAPVGARANGETMFKNQLDLLTRQLDALAEQGVEAALADLAAYGSFLQDRGQGDDDRHSQLKLTREQPDG